VSQSPRPSQRPQQVLRVDDRTGTRATPRQDLICPRCGHRFRIWTEQPPCQGFDLVAPCPHCRVSLQLRLVITQLEPAPSVPGKPEPLRDRGRARRLDPLRTYREDREPGSGNTRPAHPIAIADAASTLQPTPRDIQCQSR